MSPLYSPRQLNDHFVFGREGGAADNAESERISGGLPVFRAALPALDLGQFITHVLDDPSRFIPPGITTTEGIRAPRAEIVAFEFALGERKQAPAAKAGFILGTPQICEHLGPKDQQNAPGLFLRIPHIEILPEQFAPAAPKSAGKQDSQGSCFRGRER